MVYRVSRTACSRHCLPTTITAMTRHDNNNRAPTSPPSRPSQPVTPSPAAPPHHPATHSATLTTLCLLNSHRAPDHFVPCVPKHTAQLPKSPPPSARTHPNAPAHTLATSCPHHARGLALKNGLPCTVGHPSNPEGRPRPSRHQTAPLRHRPVIRLIRPRGYSRTIDPQSIDWGLDFGHACPYCLTGK